MSVACLLLLHQCSCAAESLPLLLKCAARSVEHAHISRLPADQAATAGCAAGLTKLAITSLFGGIGGEGGCLEHLAALPNLRHLDLDDVCGQLDWGCVSSLSGLTAFHAPADVESLTADTQLPCMPALRRLSGVRICDGGLSLLARQAPSLETLAADGWLLTAADLAAVMPNLRCLSCVGSKRNVSFLYFQPSYMDGRLGLQSGASVGISSLQFASCFPSLQQLKLRGAEQPPSCFSDLTQLTELSLSYAPGPELLQGLAAQLPACAAFSQPAGPWASAAEVQASLAFCRQLSRLEFGSVPGNNPPTLSATLMQDWVVGMVDSAVRRFSLSTSDALGLGNPLPVAICDALARWRRLESVELLSCVYLQGLSVLARAPTTTHLHVRMLSSSLSAEAAEQQVHQLRHEQQAKEPSLEVGCYASLL